MTWSGPPAPGTMAEVTDEASKGPTSSVLPQSTLEVSSLELRSLLPPVPKATAELTEQSWHYQRH